MADRNAAVPSRFKVSDHARKNIVLAYKTWPSDVATQPHPVGIVTLKTARLCDDQVRFNLPQLARDSFHVAATCRPGKDEG